MQVCVFTFYEYTLKRLGAKAHTHVQKTIMIDSFDCDKVIHIAAADTNHYISLLTKAI